MSREDDTESIASLLSESEDETEIQPVKLKKKIKKQEVLVEPEIQYTKTGRIKKPMTEAHKENLARARVRARAVRKELSELRKSEKAIKQDDRLMRKLAVEAKILEHNERKKELFVKAGYINEKDANLKKKPRAQIGAKDNLIEENEEETIKKLEDQLAHLKTKPKSLKKPKEPEPEIESESEFEIEQEIIEPPKLKRTVQKKPEMNLKPKREEQSNPMARQQPIKSAMNPEMILQMQSLFPGWKP
jgi:hypothetical protein